MYGDAKARMTKEHDAFQAASMDKQAYWVSGNGGEKFFLPVMAKTDLPTQDQLDCAAELFSKYKDEAADGTLRLTLERIAVFMRNEVATTKYVNSCRLSSVQREAQAKLALEMERSRVAAARFLLERSKPGELACTTFLVHESGKNGTDLEAFKSRPLLIDTIAKFSGALRSFSTYFDSIPDGVVEANVKSVFEKANR